MIASSIQVGVDPKIGSTPNRNSRVAIVHDDFIQHGGAERLVLAILEIWSEADLYAIIASDQWQDEIKIKFGKEVRTSWLQKLPFTEKLFRQYYGLYPLAIESFRFDDYDLVISSSARYAHGILTKPSTVHVAYVNSPARFLWEEELIPQGLVARSFIGWHRAWDKVASQRPDYIVANSTTPANRIRKYWNREPDSIINPFVVLERFEKGTNLIKGTVPKKEISDLFGGDYFLVVSRLNRWKRIDLAIQACNDLKLSLIVVGQGEDEERLRRMSGPSIRFLHDVQDDQLVELYRGCRALIQTQEEDFGITALEAQACGRPAIAYGQGGALETIQEGVTGVYFKDQSVAGLKEVLAQFDEKKYMRENCLRQAGRYSKVSFQENLKGLITHVLRTR